MSEGGALVVLTEQDVARRRFWVDEISRLSGDYRAADRLAQGIEQELENIGVSSLLSHIRTCGAVPEEYVYDNTKERLYSTYTDIIIQKACTILGLTSSVLKRRAVVTNVECTCDDYSFVADAVSFRLGRSTTNGRDFKLRALDSWKHGKPFGMIVCPVYQLPSRASRLYESAAVRRVLICTYTHLAALVRYAQQAGGRHAMALLHGMFRTIEGMRPSKSSVAYWKSVNRTFLGFDQATERLWREEKLACLEAIDVAKEEALLALAAERARILRLSRREAIQEVLRGRNVAGRVESINAINDNNLLEH